MHWRKFIRTSTLTKISVNSGEIETNFVNTIDSKNQLTSGNQGTKSFKC